MPCPRVESARDRREIHITLRGHAAAPSWRDLYVSNRKETPSRKRRSYATRTRESLTSAAEQKSVAQNEDKKGQRYPGSTRPSPQVRAVDASGDRSEKRQLPAKMPRLREAAAKNFKNKEKKFKKKKKRPGRGGDQGATPPRELAPWSKKNACPPHWITDQPHWQNRPRRKVRKT